MSYNATVFNVMIASPSDVDVERSIIRSVVYEWNNLHSLQKQIVLLPLGWDTHSYPALGNHPQTIINEQVVKKSDILIAVFGTRIGTQTERYLSGTIEEISEHKKLGKPVMLYFSNKPVSLEKIDLDQYRILEEFKKSCKEEGIFSSFDDDVDFKEKLERHISLLINENEYILNQINSTNETMNYVNPLDIERNNILLEFHKLTVTSQEYMITLINSFNQKINSYKEVERLTNSFHNLINFYSVHLTVLSMFENYIKDIVKDVNTYVNIINLKSQSYLDENKQKILTETFNNIKKTLEEMRKHIMN